MTTMLQSVSTIMFIGKPYSEVGRYSLLFTTSLVLSGVLLAALAAPVDLILLAFSTAFLAFATITMLMFSRLRAALKEIQSSITLEGSLTRYGISPHNYFYDGSSATASLQLLHLKILFLANPKHTLELGSGNTTKLISAYLQVNPSADAITLESNKEWMKVLEPNIQHEYRHCSLTPQKWHSVSTNKERQIKWYDGLEIADGRRFNYILVDGPNAFSRDIRFARAGILNIIESILAEDFVVVFDDTDRAGERYISKEFAQILRQSEVPYTFFQLRGIKTQDVYCSKSYSFLKTS